MAQETPAHLVWIDMEMSGLDVGRERILEIAMVVTDSQLNIIEEAPDFIVHQSDEILGAMDEWNRVHHKNSGLTESVRKSMVSDRDAELALLEVLKKHGPVNTLPLAGNSVHQDRLFLSKYMPELEGYLHYRNIDVSSVKELVKRWIPPVYSKRPGKKAAHRALFDIRESIEELKFYKENAFKAAGSDGEIRPTI